MNPELYEYVVSLCYKMGGLGERQPRPFLIKLNLIWQNYTSYSQGKINSQRFSRKKVFFQPRSHFIILSVDNSHVISNVKCPVYDVVSFFFYFNSSSILFLFLSYIVLCIVEMNFNKNYKQYFQPC